MVKKGEKSDKGRESCTTRTDEGERRWDAYIGLVHLCGVASTSDLYPHDWPTCSPPPSSWRQSLIPSLPLLSLLKHLAIINLHAQIRVNAQAADFCLASKKNHFSCIALSIHPPHYP